MLTFGHETDETLSMLRCVNPVLRRWAGVSAVGSCTVAQDRPPASVAAMTPKPSGVLPAAQHFVGAGHESELNRAAGRS